MSDRAITVTLDGVATEVPSSTTVAALLLNTGAASRDSVAGERRAAFCGMGTCHECRVTIDGVAHRRACMITVAAGMQIHSAPTTG